MKQEEKGKFCNSCQRGILTVVLVVVPQLYSDLVFKESYYLSDQ